MKDKLAMRTWAGPLVIGSFAVVAVTGILLFFHVDIGLAKAAHEWLSLILVVGAVAHTALNWRPFLAYFRKPAGMAIIGVMLALGVASLGVSLVGSAGGHEHGPPAMMAATRAMETSSLRVVAQVAKSSPEAIVEKLKTAGIQVRSADQTIGEIASENGARNSELLGEILGGAGS